MKRSALRRGCAAAIALVLVLHAIASSPSQLLWACHVASVLMAIGLAFDLPRAIAVGVVFHLGLGIPAFLVNVFVLGTSTPTSVLAHTIPIAAGLWALWGRPLPRGILLPAWLLHPVSMAAAYLFADPALNVMLVRAPYAATASWFGSRSMSSLAYLAMSLGSLTMGWLVLRLGWRRWE